MAAVLLAGSAAYAQTPAADRLKEIEELPIKARKHKTRSFGKDLFEAEILANAGYGIHHVEGAFENSFGPSREIFLNILEIRFNPCRFVSLKAGADVKWDHFTARTNRSFALDGSGNVVINPTGGFDRYESTLCLTAMSVPAALGLHFGELSMYGGAELIRNINGCTHILESTKAGDLTTSSRLDGGAARKFVYDFMAAVSYNGLGLYFKYYPGNILPDGGPEWKYWTAGLVLGF